MRVPKFLVSLLTGCVLGAAVPSVNAASDAWDGSTDGVWATSANWLTDPVTVPGAADTATFNGAGNGNTTLNLGGGVTISNITFDTASAAAYTIGSGTVGSQVLTLGNNSLISLSSTVASNQLFNATLALPTGASPVAALRNDSASTLTIAGAVNSVPASGNGVLNITNGGPIVISGVITETGAGNNALFKRGPGTVTLSGGSTWSGTGAASGGFSGPLFAQQGVLVLNGTNTVTGEPVIGGVVVNGGAGQNAKIQVDGGLLNVTAFLSVGRGNGVGGVSSDLELNNNARVTTASLSAGYNGGSGLNLPRGSITLNGTSSFQANGSFFFGESSGADFTMTVNSGAAVTNLNAAGMRISSSGKALMLINGGKVVTEGDFIMNYSTSGSTNGSTVILNGGELHVAGSTPSSTAERWMIFKRTGTSDTELIITNNGTVKLNNQTDLRYCTSGGGGSNTVTVVAGGAIIGYSDRATTVGGDVLIDLQQNSGASGATNVFNLNNGGIAQVRGVISAQTTGIRIWNFNGGTLKPNTNNANFVNLGAGTARVNVRNGGAIIDTSGFNVSTVSELQHSDIIDDNSTDGGLTKNGAGTLTIAGGYSFSGPIVVGAGTLALGTATTTPGTAGNITVNGAGLSVATSGSSIPAANLSFTGISSLGISYATLAPGAAAIAATGTAASSGTTTINISAVSSSVSAGSVVPLISSGVAMSTNGFVLGTLPPGIQGVLTNDTSTSLALLIKSSGQSLSWHGANIDNSVVLTNWTISADANWYDMTSTLVQYLQYSGNTIGDNVTFGNDGYNTDGTNYVNLSTTVVPATVRFSSGTPYRLTGSGGIGGATALVLTNNSSSIFLGTANSYTGGTVVESGTLVLNSDSALGAVSGGVVFSGGALQLDGPVSSSRAYALNAGGTSVGVITNVTATWSGGVTGTGGLNKVDDGTLTVSGAASYTGTTSVKFGALSVSGTLGTVNSDIALAPDSGDSGTLQVSGSANVAASRVIIGGNSANSGSPGAGVLNQSGGTINSRQWFTVGSGSAGGVSGSGTFNMSGGTLNIHSQQMEVGNFDATEGTVNMSGSAALNVWSNNFISLGANNNASAGTFNQNGGTVSLYSDAGLTPGGNGILYIGRAGTLSGTFTYNLNGGTLRVPQIQGNVANAATRVINFNGGTVQPTKANATFLFGLTSANMMAGGAVIDTSSNNITISQALLDGGGGLTKLGNATLTLAGTNDYSGATLVGAGKLVVNPSHQVSGQVAVSNGATFAVSLPSTNGAATIGALTLATGNPTLEFNFGTNQNSATPILMAGALTNNGTSTIRITGPFAVGVIPLLDYTGTIQGGGSFNTLIQAPQGVVATVSNNTANSTLYAVISAVGAGVVWTGTNSVNPNTWDIGTSTNWLFGASPTIYTEGDQVNFTDVGSGTVNLSNTVSPLSILISNSSVNYTLQGPGAIAGTTGLRKAGSGSATVNFTANTFTGSTVISNGTLNALGGGAIGDTSAVTLANAVGASLVVSNGSAETIGSLAGGGTTGGNVTFTGTLNMGGNNAATSFGGTITSVDGELNKLGTGSFALSNSVDVGQFNVDNSTLNVTGTLIAEGGAGSRIRVGRNAGNAVMNVQPGGTVIANWSLIPGSDTSTGTINVNGGTVVHQGGLNIYLGSGNTGSTGVLALASGVISNIVGGMILGEGGNSVGIYTQSGGTALLGSDVVVGQTAAANLFTMSGGTAESAMLRIALNSGAGDAVISGGTYTAGEVVVATGSSPTSTGTGSLTVSGAAVLNVTNNLRVAFAGSATKSGALTNNGGTINITGGDIGLEMSRWDALSGSLQLNSGSINLQNNTSIAFGGQNNTGIASFDQAGGAVTFYSDGGTTIGGTGSLNLALASGGGTYTYNLNGGTLTVPRIQKTAASLGTFNFGGGTLRAAANSGNFMEGLTAANVLTPGAIIDTAGRDITVAQPLVNDGIVEDGGLAKNGAGVLYLNGANTYTNLTTVNAGALGGSGTIAGSVVVNSGGALAPGDAAAIGTLTISNNLNLAGNLRVKVNTGVSPSNDVCTVLGSASYTGSGKSVIVTNLGPVLAAGNTFKLFSAGVSGAQNLTITGGGAGVVWTNELATLGQIRVLSAATVPTTPTSLSYVVTPGNITLSWPSNYLGWSLQTQTNLRSVGLSTNWVTIPNSHTVTTTNFAVSPASPTVFYRLFYAVP
jgi:autotransporter-associated beta strand protein